MSTSAEPPDLLDRPHRLLGSFGIGADDSLGCRRLQHHHRDRVRDHVVELAGDAPALELDRLLRAVFGRRLGERSATGQRVGLACARRRARRPRATTQ